MYAAIPTSASYTSQPTSARTLRERRRFTLSLSARSNENSNGELLNRHRVCELAQTCLNKFLDLGISAISSDPSKQTNSRILIWTGQEIRELVKPAKIDTATPSSPAARLHTAQLLWELLESCKGWGRDGEECAVRVEAPKKDLHHADASETGFAASCGKIGSQPGTNWGVREEKKSEREGPCSSGKLSLGEAESLKQSLRWVVYLSKPAVLEQQHEKLKQRIKSSLLPLINGTNSRFFLLFPAFGEITAVALVSFLPSSVFDQRLTRTSNITRFTTHTAFRPYVGKSYVIGGTQRTVEYPNPRSQAQSKGCIGIIRRDRPLDLDNTVREVIVQNFLCF
ncbi:hypothetical protein B0H13DRAFT_1905133 [Mycena leptocephala]|nr:hypothetical protein B0H13DRAFT_1905133 [Mycena leptocephala]